MPSDGHRWYGLEAQEHACQRRTHRPRGMMPLNTSQRPAFRQMIVVSAAAVICCRHVLVKRRETLDRCCRADRCAHALRRHILGTVVLAILTHRTALHPYRMIYTLASVFLMGELDLRDARLPVQMQDLGEVQNGGSCTPALLPHCTGTKVQPTTATAINHSGRQRLPSES